MWSLDRSVCSAKIQSRFGTPFHFRRLKNGSSLFLLWTTGEEFGKFIHTDNKLAIESGLVLPAGKNNRPVLHSWALFILSWGCIITVSLRRSVILNQSQLCKSCIFLERTSKRLPLPGSRFLPQSCFLQKAQKFKWRCWSITKESQRVGWTRTSIPSLWSLVLSNPAHLVASTGCMHVSDAKIQPLYTGTEKSTRLLCPWDSPGKNSKVGCHFYCRGSSQPRNQTQVSCVSTVPPGNYTLFCTHTEGLRPEGR